MNKEKIQGLLAESSGLEMMIAKEQLDEHYSSKQQVKDDVFNSRLASLKEKLNATPVKRKLGR